MMFRDVTTVLNEREHLKVVISSVSDSVSLNLGRTEWPGLTALHRAHQVDLVRHRTCFKCLCHQLAYICIICAHVCAILQVWPVSNSLALFAAKSTGIYMQYVNICTILSHHAGDQFCSVENMTWVGFSYPAQYQNVGDISFPLLTRNFFTFGNVRVEPFRAPKGTRHSSWVLWIALVALTIVDCTCNEHELEN